MDLQERFLDPDGAQILTADALTELLEESSICRSAAIMDRASSLVAWVVARSLVEFAQH